MLLFRSVSGTRSPACRTRTRSPRPRRPPPGADPHPVPVDADPHAARHRPRPSRPDSGSTSWASNQIPGSINTFPAVVPNGARHRVLAARRRANRHDRRRRGTPERRLQDRPRAPAVNPTPTVAGPRAGTRRPSCSAASLTPDPGVQGRFFNRSCSSSWPTRAGTPLRAVHNRGLGARGPPAHDTLFDAGGTTARAQPQDAPRGGSGLRRAPGLGTGGSAWRGPGGARQPVPDTALGRLRARPSATSRSPPPPHTRRGAPACSVDRQAHGHRQPQEVATRRTTPRSTSAWNRRSDPTEHPRRSARRCLSRVMNINIDRARPERAVWTSLSCAEESLAVEGDLFHATEHRRAERRGVRRVVLRVLQADVERGVVRRVVLRPARHRPRTADDPTDARRSARRGALWRARGRPPPQGSLGAGRSAAPGAASG